jgi:hypothetical protein
MRSTPRELDQPVSSQPVEDRGERSGFRDLEFMPRKPVKPLEVSRYEAKDLEDGSRDQSQSVPPQLPEYVFRVFDSWRELPEIGLGQHDPQGSSGLSRRRQERRILGGREVANAFDD